MTKLRFLFALSAVAVVSIAFAACGGDDAASDLSPTEVLEQTFSGDHDLTSGVLGISASAEVPGEQGGSGEFSVEAPFNNNGEGEIPDLSLSIEADGEGDGESFEFSGGGTLTPDGAALTVDDTSYEVPKEFFDFFTQIVERASGQNQKGEQEQPSLEDLGFSPDTWFSELTNEGTEDIDGAETVHVSGALDITTAIRDALGSVEKLNIPGAQLPPGFDASQLGFLESFIEEASFDVYSETDGYLLRKLDFTLVLQNLGMVSGDDSDSGSDGATFELSVTISEPNEEQDISLPEDAESFDDLRAKLREDYGFDIGDLGALGALGGAGGLGALGGKGEQPGVNKAYLDCFENAGSPEALEQCAEEL